MPLVTQPPLLQLKASPSCDGLRGCHLLCPSRNQQSHSEGSTATKRTIRHIAVWHTIVSNGSEIIMWTHHQLGNIWFRDNCCWTCLRYIITSTDEGRHGTVWILNLQLKLSACKISNNNIKSYRSSDAEHSKRRIRLIQFILPWFSICSAIIRNPPIFISTTVQGSGWKLSSTNMSCFRRTWSYLSGAGRERPLLNTC